MLSQKLLASSGSEQAPAQRQPSPASAGPRAAATRESNAAPGNGLESSHAVATPEGAPELVAVNKTAAAGAADAPEHVSCLTTTDEDSGERAAEEKKVEEEEEEEAPQVALQTCVECEDQRAELTCLSCEEPFCRPCWGSLHRCVS